MYCISHFLSTFYHFQKEQFLTMIPGFGPNNQYLGLKDVMYIAKKLNRTLGRPSFFLQESFRPFDKTFQSRFLDPYLPTISFDEYRDICGGVIDTLVWSRFEGDPIDWYPTINIWMNATKMKYKGELKSSIPLWLGTEKEIVKKFEPVKDKRCIALVCPFKNVQESTERQSLATLLVHSKEIKDLASRALVEMKVNTSDMLAIHWRWGEDSCGRWLSPRPHTDYDFCWGTSVFHFARVKDVTESLKKFVRSRGITHIFLSVSKSYRDEDVLRKLVNSVKLENITIFVGSDLDTFKPITDNYYLSLIEQELCSVSGFFIASGDSTWSEFVLEYRKELQKEPKFGNFSLHDSFTESLTFERLLGKKLVTSWDSTRDLSKLELRPKKERGTYPREE
eukprot:TRINITY_DN4383_c0_g4_i4.p1 TRINITY_DN4383_c0_g4~~TRINITY_DN4383_c0_g4_i4.p1  ORF type:complete len:393 (+),score=66.95 TRINITY_DN4383_c0_g4_i4:313-1491(+)